MSVVLYKSDFRTPALFYSAVEQAGYCGDPKSLDELVINIETAEFFDENAGQYDAGGNVLVKPKGRMSHDES